MHADLIAHRFLFFTLASTAVRPLRHQACAPSPRGLDCVLPCIAEHRPLRGRLTGSLTGYGRARTQVALDDDLADKLAPSERASDGSLDEEARRDALRRVAKAARKQGLYALAARKYTQVCPTLRAIQTQANNSTPAALPTARAASNRVAA